MLSRANCLFQPEISNLLIDEDDGNRFGFGSPGYEKSTIGRVLSAEDTTYTIIDDGRLLTTENPEILVNSLFVWSRNGELFSPGDKPMIGKDTLLVSCSHTETRIDALPGMYRPIVKCRRRFISDRISISYLFESATPVPLLEAVSRFDQAIVDWLTQAECKNNPISRDGNSLRMQIDQGLSFWQSNLQQR